MGGFSLAPREERRFLSFFVLGLEFWVLGEDPPKDDRMEDPGRFSWDKFLSTLQPQTLDANP